MLWLLIAMAGALALTWWPWRGQLGSALARTAAASRFIALGALALLLIDPATAIHGRGSRPLVLLDNSVSMHSHTSTDSVALRQAAGSAEVFRFGDLAGHEPAGTSMLHDALLHALGDARPVTVITDGEIADAATIPADVLDQVSVKVFPRQLHNDVALVSVSGPLRATAGDTIRFEVTASRTGTSPDSVGVEVRDSTAVLMRGAIHFHGSAGMVRMSGLIPAAARGDHWLTIARSGPADDEPDDDTRWWLLQVAPTPAVVVLAERPDFDARALYRTIHDVSDLPVRGYIALRHGEWRRMEDLAPVREADVDAAARVADLLAVRGDDSRWNASRGARLVWPAADQPGDWYVNAAPASPVAGAFAGIELDSLPPATAIRRARADTVHGWIGATARSGRRGSPEPIMLGRETRAGRRIDLAADGLFRWTLRGGTADQAWRSMIAAAVSWLLGGSGADSSRVRPLRAVVERGQPVRFHWLSGAMPGVPLAITLRSATAVRTDSLRFDGVGDAEIVLPVGRYSYRIEGGSGGVVAVEPYSDELVAHPVTLKSHTGRGSRSVTHRSVRELIWLFLLALIGFSGEWILRKRIGAI